MLRQIRNISSVFLKRWLSDGKTLFGFFLLLFFSYVTYVPMNDVVSSLGVKASPWLFSFFFSQTTLLLVIAGVTILVFSDTFVVDTYTQLMLVRTGRKTYIWGQIVFVLTASLIVVGVAFVGSMFTTIPSISWDTNWGKVIHTIADQPQLIIERTGAEVYFTVNRAYIDAVRAIPSTLLSILLLWLYTTFTAFLIGSFRILTGRMIGVVISGFLTFLSMFAANLGLLAYGDILRYFSPLLWCTPVNLNWYGIRGYPTVGFVVSVYSLCICLMIACSVIWAQHGDIQETKGG